MRSGLLWVLLAPALLAASAGASQELPPAGGASSGSAQETPAALRVDFDFTRAWTADEIQAGLLELERLYPDWLTLREIGRDRNGTPIPCALLGRPQAAGEAPRPTLLLCDWAEDNRQFGARAVLFTLHWMLQNRTRDAQLARLLETRNLLAVPLVDPAAYSLTPAEGLARLQASFPVGWQPEGFLPGAGPYPLSLPSARALAELLLATPNVSAALYFGQPRGALPVERGAELVLAPRDREAFAQLERAGTEAGARSLELWPWSRLGARRGSFADYCASMLGVYALELNLPEPQLGPEQSPLLQELARSTQRALAKLPELSLELMALESLAPQQWQLDVRVRNSGSLPTSSSLAQSRGKALGLQLALSGGAIFGVARRSGPQASFEMPPAGAPMLSDLGPGEAAELRLCFRASAGSALELKLWGPRAGSVALALSLP